MRLYHASSFLRSFIRREDRCLRSRNSAGGTGFDQLRMIEDVRMSLKEHAAGYSALAGYTGLTQIFGVNFFQLAPDYRAWWLVGAVCVLGIITNRGRHSPQGSR